MRPPRAVRAAATLAAEWVLVGTEGALPAMGGGCGSAAEGQSKTARGLMAYAPPTSQGLHWTFTFTFFHRSHALVHWIASGRLPLGGWVRAVRLGR